MKDMRERRETDKGAERRGREVGDEKSERNENSRNLGGKEMSEGKSRDEKTYEIDGEEWKMR